MRCHLHTGRPGAGDPDGRVRLLDRDESSPNTILLEIKGEVIFSQVPEALYIKTELDLESGQIAVKDRNNG